VIKVGQPPAGLKHQSRDLRQFAEINLVHRVGRPVIIHVSAVKIKNDGHAMLGVIPVIGTVIDAFRIIGIVVVIIQLQLLKLGIRFLADPRAVRG